MRYIELVVFISGAGYIQRMKPASMHVSLGEKKASCICEESFHQQLNDNSRLAIKTFISDMFVPQ